MEVKALSEYKLYVETALNVGVSTIEIKEVLYYQSTPYVGKSKIINSVFTTNDIVSGRNIMPPMERIAKPYN